MSLLSLLLVGAGGFIGAIARFATTQAINKKSSSTVPVSTLTVNILGSFILGFLTGSTAGHALMLFFGTGMMGAFTTFSTFKLEGVQLHLKKEKRAFLYYNVCCYAGGILSAYIGLMLGRLL